MNEKEIIDLLKLAKAYLPYVTATLSPGNTTPSKERPNWILVHRGRAASSSRQLEHLERRVDELLSKYSSEE